MAFVCSRLGPERSPGRRSGALGRPRLGAGCAGGTWAALRQWQRPRPQSGAGHCCTSRPLPLSPLPPSCCRRRNALIRRAGPTASSRSPEALPPPPSRAGPGITSSRPAAKPMLGTRPTARPPSWCSTGDVRDLQHAGSPAPSQRVAMGMGLARARGASPRPGAGPGAGRHRPLPCRARAGAEPGAGG